MTTITDTVLLETSEQVATVTLNRPEKLNALSGELMDALGPIIERVAEDSEVRCVVVTGAGRGFCDGGDIASMASGEAVPDESPVAHLRRRE